MGICIMGRNRSSEERGRREKMIRSFLLCPWLVMWSKCPPQILAAGNPQDFLQ